MGGGGEDGLKSSQEKTTFNCTFVGTMLKLHFSTATVYKGMRIEEVEVKWAGTAPLF